MIVKLQWCNEDYTPYIEREIEYCNVPTDIIVLLKLHHQIHHNWAFFQLEQFIEYKAESLGKILIKIDPSYTSQECSHCAEINKNNRKGLRYKCQTCGFELHSDLNASRNIANRGMSVVSRVLSTTHTHQHPLGASPLL